MGTGARADPEKPLNRPDACCLFFIGVCLNGKPFVFAQLPERHVW